MWHYHKYGIDYHLYRILSQIGVCYIVVGVFAGLLLLNKQVVKIIYNDD